MNIWRNFIAQSPLRKLGHETLVTALASLAPRAFGFAKEIVVASIFGLSDNLDIYLMAFVLIGFPLSVFISSIQATLISTLSKNENHGTLYASTAGLTLLLLATALPFWLVFLHHSLPWIASSFSPEKLIGLESALYYLIPYYFFNAINLLAYGVLQAKRHFLANGLLPALTPLSIMPLVYFFGDSGDWKVLAIALMVGALAECIWLHVRLFKSGLLVRPKLFNNVQLSQLSTASIALLPGSFMLGIGPLIDQAIAGSLGTGAISALAYGYRLPAALNGILIAAIGITILPYFSSLLSQKEVHYCLHSFHRLTLWLLIGSFILIIPFVIGSDSIVQLLYQRGAFTSNATEIVMPIQQVYLMQLPFALISMLCIRTLIATENNKIVSILSGVAVLIQAGLAWWLGMEYGALGIALAAMIVSTLLAASSFIYARLCLRTLIV